MNQPEIVFQPWTAFPGAKPCAVMHPGGRLVCTREKGHEGVHAVGIDGKITWEQS